MKQLLLVLLAVAGCFGVSDPAAADGRAITAEAFTEEFARALAGELPEGGFEVTGPLEIAIADETSGRGTINLHNLYRNASDDPAERALQIRSYVSAMLAEPTDTLSAGDRANILPVIRDAQYVAQATVNRDDPAISTPLVADLSVLYVLDFPDRVQFLVDSNLAELGTNLDEVHSLALNNLSAKADDYVVQTMEQIYYLELDGMYESSALLLDDFWSRIEAEIGAAPVAAIPTRDILIFVPSNDPLGVELVRQIAAQIEEETGYPISRTLLIRQDGSWEAYP